MKGRAGWGSTACCPSLPPGWDGSPSRPLSVSLPLPTAYRFYLQQVGAAPRAALVCLQGRAGCPQPAVRRLTSAPLSVLYSLTAQRTAEDSRPYLVQNANRLPLPPVMGRGSTACCPSLPLSGPRVLRPSSPRAMPLPLTRAPRGLAALTGSFRAHVLFDPHHESRDMFLEQFKGPVSLFPSAHKVYLVHDIGRIERVEIE